MTCLYADTHEHKYMYIQYIDTCTYNINSIHTVCVHVHVHSYIHTVCVHVHSYIHTYST